MPNKPGKPTSKRTPVRLRHKIEKASAAKQRKQRKLSKKNPEWRSRLKKDPGIPNLFPYKDKILHEIEEKKRLKEEEYARKREEAKAKQSTEEEARDDGGPEEESQEDAELSDLVDEDEEHTSTPANSNPLSALLESARARATEYDNAPRGAVDSDDDAAMEEDSSRNGTPPPPLTTSSSMPSGRRTLDTSRRAYDKIFKSVLTSSDVLLYVLDARDPDGTRSVDIEREIAAAEGGSKRLILLLNKIDLVPPPVLKAWLLYLRRYALTLPLRASTPAPNAKIFDHKALTLRGTTETLLKALKAYAHAQNLKRSITVGVVGYPNVGKSSVINALLSRGGTRVSACPVGAEAGVTTALQQVKLDGNLKLLDSPGIVFPSSSSSISTSPDTLQLPNLTPKQQQTAHLTLLSALPPSARPDPVAAVTLLLHRLSHHSSATLSPLLDHYGLQASSLVPSGPDSNDRTTDFLVQVARKRGRLGKGGVPNLTSAATCVLMDWRDGRVRGWMDAPAAAAATALTTTAPAVVASNRSNEAGAEQVEVVKEWAQEFKLDGLWGDDDDDGQEPPAEEGEQMQL